MVGERKLRASRSVCFHRYRTPDSGPLLQYRNNVALVKYCDPRQTSNMFQQRIATSQEDRAMAAALIKERNRARGPEQRQGHRTRSTGIRPRMQKLETTYWVSTGKPSTTFSSSRSHNERRPRRSWKHFFLRRNSRPRRQSSRYRTTATEVRADDLIASTNQIICTQAPPQGGCKPA